MPAYFKNIVIVGKRRGYSGLLYALIVAVMLLNTVGVSHATAGPPVTAVIDLITQADTIVVGQLTGQGTAWQLNVIRTLQGTAPASITVNIGTLNAAGSSSYYGIWFLAQGTVIPVDPVSGTLADAFVSLPTGNVEASFSYAVTDPTVDKIAAEVERALSDGQPADLQPPLFNLLLELIRINDGASYTHIYGLDPSHKTTCQTLKLMKDWGAIVAQKAQTWTVSGTALPSGMSSSIASISSPSAITSLSQIIASTTDVNLLRNATTALRNIHTPATIPLLRPLLDNADLSVEFAAESGIALNANHCVPKTTIECPQSRVVAGGGLPIEMQNFVSWSAFQANPSQYVSFWKQWVDCQTCLPGAPPPPVAAPTVTSSSNATVTVNVPAAMVAGQQYTATFTVTNTGTGTWSPVGSGCNAFTLGSQNPQNNTTWGVSRAVLPTSVAPGAAVSFTATITAPATAGVYNFQWQMLQECVASFGAPSANMAILVTAPPTGTENGTVSVNVPATMVVGQQYLVSFTVNNTGTAGWSFVGPYCDAINLASINPVDTTTWAPASINLPSTVAAGTPLTFNATITAPSSPGVYNFQWQLQQECVNLFGTPSTNVTVTVNPPPSAPAASTLNATVSANVPATMVAGQQYTATFTVTNTGTTNWTYVGPHANAVRLGAMNPYENTNWGTARIDLPYTVAVGASLTFSTTITAPATPGVYNFQWGMLLEGVGPWFGSGSNNTAVNVVSYASTLPTPTPTPTPTPQPLTLVKCPGNPTYYNGRAGNPGSGSGIVQFSGGTSPISCSVYKGGTSGPAGGCDPGQLGSASGNCSGVSWTSAVDNGTAGTCSFQVTVTATSADGQRNQQCVFTVNDQY